MTDITNEDQDEEMGDKQSPLSLDQYDPLTLPEEALVPYIAAEIGEIYRKVTPIFDAISSLGVDINVTSHLNNVSVLTGRMCGMLALSAHRTKEQAKFIEETRAVQRNLEDKVSALSAAQNVNKEEGDEDAHY